MSNIKNFISDKMNEILGFREAKSINYIEALGALLIS